MVKTKRIEQQIKLTADEKAREQRKIEKGLEQWLEKNAIKNGEEYFDKVIYALKSKMEDVKKDKRNWKLAVKRKPHPNGYIADKNVIINQIIWTMDSVKQIDFHYGDGARAVGLLSTALKIQL